MMRTICCTLVACVGLTVTAYAQPLFAVNDTVTIGVYREVVPESGFGESVGVRCGIGFGGIVKVIFIEPDGDYFVQYAPTTNPRGVLNECSGLKAYFSISEQELLDQQGKHAAIVANPPQ